MPDRKGSSARPFYEHLANSPALQVGLPASTGRPRAIPFGRAQQQKMGTPKSEIPWANLAWSLPNIR